MYADTRGGDALRRLQLGQVMGDGPAPVIDLLRGRGEVLLEGEDTLLQGEDAYAQLVRGAGRFAQAGAAEDVGAMLALERGFVLWLGRHGMAVGVGGDVIREGVRTNEGINAETGVAALLMELAAEVVFHLRVAAARRAGRQGGRVRFRSVAHPGDVDEGLAVLDLAAEHALDGAPVGREVGLLDGMAVDGEQDLFDDLPDAAQVAAGGGDEDLGRVHEKEILNLRKNSSIGETNFAVGARLISSRLTSVGKATYLVEGNGGRVPKSR